MFPSIVLLLWLFVAIFLFAWHPPAKAIAYVVFVGMLFMPELTFLPIPLPVIKMMDKQAVTSTAGILGCYFFARKRLRMLRIGRGIDVLLWLTVISSVITAMLNQDLLVYGPRLVAALTINDTLLYPAYAVLGGVFPFWLGRMAVTSIAEAKQLIRIVVVMGLIYSLLELFEMRMSPTLHAMIYGISPFENMSMAVRWGGYRPTVFFAHGLATAMFTLVASLLAAAQTMYRKRLGRFSTKVVALYLFSILVLCKSTGAILFGAVMVPAILFLKPKRCFALISTFALLFCLYPTLRIMKAFPDDALDSYYATAGPEVQDRLSSLKFRFLNELILTDKASQRFWFGWGGNGRNLVYGQDGDTQSVTDGAWVISLGSEGVIGFSLHFGLLIVVLLYAGRRARLLRVKENQVMLAGFSFALLSYLLDMIPNGTFNMAPQFLAGVVWQFAKMSVDEENRPEATPEEGSPQLSEVAVRGPRRVIIVR